MSINTSFPKGVIKKISGRCIVLHGDDIDTDRIIPARFLKCVSFQDLGEQVFADDRTELKGMHPFDITSNKGASILVVNDNFGCGSSREHAPQALMRWGIRAVIGQSFAEIFYGNCLALGIPCATTSKDMVNNLQAAIKHYSQKILELDLNRNSAYFNGVNYPISIESGALEMLTTGQWDATTQLIAQKDSLERVISRLPYLNNFEDKIKTYPRN